ncbi:MAG: FUN14 domain-containing protein [Nitrososphaeraceae archaeon]
MIGYALKKVLKILSIVIGLFLAGLTYLRSQEIAKNKLG